MGHYTVGPAWKMARPTVWNMELVQEKLITSELPNWFPVYSGPISSEKGEGAALHMLSNLLPNISKSLCSLMLQGLDEWSKNAAIFLGLAN